MLKSKSTTIYFGRMVALVRIKGATRQRGLKLRLRDLGKIWFLASLAHLLFSMWLPSSPLSRLFFPLVPRRLEACTLPRWSLGPLAAEARR